MAFLRVLKGSVPGQILELLGERMVFGRSPDCEIVLDSSAVSRQHGQILNSHGKYFLEDLRSRNGILVNGNGVDGRVELSEGDQIKFCNIQFSFHNDPLPLQETLQEESERLARSLRQHHLHYTGRWVNELQKQLHDERSAGFQMLAEGFYRMVVLDAEGGQDSFGEFDIDLFLRHIRRRMADSFGHSLDESVFHPEQIAQVLKDEEQTLFCFLNVQLLSEHDLHRLRGLGFTQEEHRVLYCGPNEYLGTKSLPVSRISPDLIEPPGQDVTEEPGHDEGIEAFEMDSTYSPSLRFEMKPEVKLRAILEINEALGRTLNLDEIIEKTLDGLFRIFPQTNDGFILLKDEERNKLVVKATKSWLGGDKSSVNISMTAVKQAMQNGEAILTTDRVNKIRFGEAKHQIRSLMCVPLLAAEEVALGVIQLDTLDMPRGFSQDDLDLMVSVTSQASMALENARLHAELLKQRDSQRDIEFAAQIQFGLLPPQPPQVPGYEFSDFYETAMDVGGDYFDYIVFPDGRIAISLGEVAGKGVSVALLMARLLSSSRLHLLTAPNVADAMTRLNVEIASSDLEHRFVTCIMLLLDPRTHEATFAKAGHAAPIRRNRSKQTTLVGADETDMPLGVDADQQFKQHQIHFDRGDTLVLFTDGISEAMNDAGTFYGTKRLSAYVAGGPQQMKPLVKGIVEDVELFCDGRRLRDDVCLVAIRRTD